MASSFDDPDVRGPNGSLNNDLRKAGNIGGNSALMKRFVAAIERRYGVPQADAYQLVKYMDPNFHLGDLTEGTVDDDIEWRDKELTQAIRKMGQDNGVDYSNGESWSGKEAATKKATEADAAEAEKTRLRTERADKDQANLDDVYKRLQSFADEMNMPIDQLLKSDEYAKATRNTAFNQASAPNGFSGGMSNLNADRATKDALINYQMSRQQMGQNALGQMGGLAQNMVARGDNLNQYDQNRADEWSKFNQGMDLQMQGLQAQAGQQAFAERQGAGQAIGSALGAGIGALGFLGGPALGAATMAGGSALGGGLGGGFATGFKPYKPYQYRAPKAYGGGGGLSGGGNR